MNKDSQKQNSSADEPKYSTRYGMMTAPEAAEMLLERSHFKLSFLEKILHVCDQRGEGFTLDGYDADGLACILSDINHDLHEARYYYYGEFRGESWVTEPGKVDERKTAKKSKQEEEASHE